VTAGESGDAERLRVLVDAVTEYALYLVDATGKITSWNAGARRMTGFSAEEIIGRDFADLFGDEDRQRGVPRSLLAVPASGRAASSRRRATGAARSSVSPRFCAK
jgi:PAS domain S-box-containing protein